VVQRGTNANAFTTRGKLCGYDLLAKRGAVSNYYFIETSIQLKHFTQPASLGSLPRQAYKASLGRGYA
jgi:hypothetical protein